MEVFAIQRSHIQNIKNSYRSVRKRQATQFLVGQKTLKGISQKKNSQIAKKNKK